MKADDGAEARSGRPNKSQLKRDTRVLRDLVRQLMALPPAALAKISIDEAIRDAVLAAKKMTRGALTRQLRYVTGLMRQADAELVAGELAAMSRPHQKQVQAFHRVEQWRDALLAGDEALLDELVDRLAADRQRLRQLVRDACKERDQNKPPKSARLLFGYLADLQAHR